MNYSVGDRFIIRCHIEDEYILANFGNSRDGKVLVSLVNLYTGNRWNYPVAVEDKYNITEDEIHQVINAKDVEKMGGIWAKVPKTLTQH